MTSHRERQDAKIQEMEGAIYMLLSRIHQDGFCGRDGVHLTQCLDAVKVAGYDSWETWRQLAESS